MPTTTISRPLHELVASDLMSRHVTTIPEGMSLQDAAQLLFTNQISGAPVIDEQSRCIGILSATDFVHWVGEGAKSAEEVPLLACPHQKTWRSSSGAEVVRCTLAEGSCPMQETRPTTGGRHIAVCLQPLGTPEELRELTKHLPVSAVRGYMSVNVVTVAPQTPLCDLARTMMDADIHRVVVLDALERPIGIVTSTDILAALAQLSPTGSTTECGSAPHTTSPVRKLDRIMEPQLG